MKKMNLRKLTLFSILIVLATSSGLMAQSKKKGTMQDKKVAVDAKSADSRDSETVFAYVIMDLMGKTGDYSATMMIPKSNEFKMTSDQSIMAEKNAARTASEKSFPTEIDFLKTMQDQGLEMITATSEITTAGVPYKRFYFKKEIKLNK